MELGLIGTLTLKILITYITLRVYRSVVGRAGKHLITKHNLQVTFRNKYSELSSEEQYKINYADILTRWIIIKSTLTLASIGFIYIVGHCLLGVIL